MTLLLITFAGSGLLLILIALPLIKRRIKPNYYYGFRVKQTLENEAVWYAVNAYGGGRLLICGVITTLTAVGLYLLPGLSADTYALAVAAVVVIALAIGLADTWRYLRHVARP